jgi:hypothetical protein
MGTALAVAPFNRLPYKLAYNCPRVLFNMTNTDETGNYDFTKNTDTRLFV